MNNDLFEKLMSALFLLGGVAVVSLLWLLVIIAIIQAGGFR